MFHFLSKIKNHTKREDNYSIPNPHKHWMILLLIFLILVVCLIMFSLYLLFQIRGDQVFQVKPTLDDKPTILKEDLLKNVTQIFEEKAKKENDLSTNPPFYRDPSL